MRAPEAAAAKAAAALEPLIERFSGQMALIFASGPSLPDLWSADRSIPCPSIAVNDAWRLAPAADVLYASDAAWWRHHKIVPEFGGARVGCHECLGVPGVINLELSGQEGFDERLGWLRSGNNSGYAAVHLAFQIGAKKIVLVGFDMQTVNGKDHWFGEHPRTVRKPQASPYEKWAKLFVGLGEELTKRGLEVVNATPNSALKCFPMVRLEDVIGQ